MNRMPGNWMSGAIMACGMLLVFAAPIVAGSIPWEPAGALAAGGLLLAALRLFLFWRRGARVRVSITTWLLLALAVVQALSLAVSINRDLSLKSISLTLAALCLAFPFSSPGPETGREPWSEGAKRLLAPCVGALGALAWVSVVGVREYLEKFRYDPEPRIFATFYNPDMTAGFLVMTLPICLALLWLEMPPIPTFVVSLTAIFGAIALALTASKGGWLALAAGLAALAIARRRIPHEPVRSRVFAGVSAASIAAAAACSNLLLTRLRSAGGAEANSAAFRKYVWRTAAEMILHRPGLGFGAGTFGQAYPHFAVAGPTQMAHNGYLQAGAEAGVLALLILLAASWLPPLRALVKGVAPADPRVMPSDPHGLPDGSSPKDTPPAGAMAARLQGAEPGRALPQNLGPGGWSLEYPQLAAALAPGLVGGLVAACIHNMVDFDWSIPGIWLVFWALAGALAGLSTPIPVGSAGESGPWATGRPGDSGSTTSGQRGESQSTGSRESGESKSSQGGRGGGNSSGASKAAGRHNPTRAPAIPAPRGHAAILALALALLVMAGGICLLAAAAGDLDAARNAAGQSTPPPPPEDVDFQAAIDLASSGLALDPFDGQLNLVRANAEEAIASGAPDPASSARVLDAAQADLAAAARKMPFSAAPWLRLGEIQAAQERWEDAAQSFRMALDRDPHTLPAAVSLADVEARLHHPDQERAALEIVTRTEISPFATVRGVPEAYETRYPIAWVGLARLELDAGHWNDAIQDARRAQQDLDQYATFAEKYGPRGVFSAYRPDTLKEMDGYAVTTADILTAALQHLSRPSEIPAVSRWKTNVLSRLASVKQPT